MTVLSLIMVLALSSCSYSSAKNQQKSSSNQPQSSPALASSSASVTQKSSSSAQASSSASDTQEDSSSAQASALSSTNNKTGYYAYTGSWVDSRQKGDMQKYGGTGMMLSVKSNGDITGSITTASTNLSHIAEIDFKGTIKNNIFKSYFAEDNWGHSGTVTLKFNGSEINCTIVLNSAEQSMWSIKSGTIKFIREKK